MQILNNIINLFYPKLCLNCLTDLVGDEKILCLKCTHDLPLIHIKNTKQNQIITKFFGRLPLENASSFLYYRKGNVTQKLIHELKYKNNEKIGEFLGNWFSNQLKEKNHFNNIDYIVPVPLSSKKLKIRGYNQVTKFGKALSEILNIEYIPNILQRTHSAKTQTQKNRTERFSTIKNQFLLSDVTFFENKHILLIDDVITTGATIETCCNELLKTKNIKISIATLAFTMLE